VTDDDEFAKFQRRVAAYDKRMAEIAEQARRQVAERRARDRAIEALRHSNGRMPSPIADDLHAASQALNDLPRYEREKALRAIREEWRAEKAAGMSAQAD
jgi:hypothetical protein